MTTTDLVPAVSRRAAVMFAMCCVAGAGCIVEENHYHSYDVPPPSPVSAIPLCPGAPGAVGGVSIDTDAALATNAGEGAGVFVEYKSGGHWHVFTSCDTTVSGAGCAYDVTAQVFSGAVSNIVGEDLEADDRVGSNCSDTAFIMVATGTNFDGMWFDTTAGAPVRVTAALGPTLYPNIIYWVSGGVARSDANANPLDLTPTAP